MSTNNNAADVGVILGREVRRARIDSGLTQAQLYEMTGISQTLIGRIESGKANPRLETLERIADALGLGLVIRFAEA